MASEIIKGLFGFSPQELSQQREQQDYGNALRFAQLNPLQQTSFLGMQGINTAVRGLGGAAKQLFNIQDPEMQENSLLEQGAKELYSQGVDPMSVQGLSTLIQRLNASGARPQTLERLSGALQQAQMNEAKLAAQQAQRGQAEAGAALKQNELLREQQLQAALELLPPDATDEQRMAVLSRFGSPDVQIRGIDYRNRLAAEREARMEELKQRHEFQRQEAAARRASQTEMAAMRLQQQQESNELHRELAQGRLEDQRLKREEVAEKKTADKQGKLANFDIALSSLDRIEKHPGLKSAVGFGGKQLSMIPGTPAAGFAAQLDTFKAQVFLPQVAYLKGTGALSDAEGKKLTDAIGALSQDMEEGEFLSQIRIIRNDLEAAKKRVSGTDKPKNITVDY